MKSKGKSLYLFMAAMFVAAGLFGTATAQDVPASNRPDEVSASSVEPISTSSEHDATAPSQEQVVAGIKQRFAERFEGLEATAVTPTPFEGLYEIQLGGDLLYTNAQVDFLMQGALIDTVSRRDLTSERLARLAEVPFDDLPLHLAIKQVRGNGKRQIAVFEDPNCGYCRMLHQTLQEIDNVTVYTLLFPILSPDSRVKAENIWCAQDQAGTWLAWMLDRKTPPESVCETPIDQILELGRKLQVRGTPAIFFADGSRVNGALPLPQLRQKLDSMQ